MSQGKGNALHRSLAACKIWPCDPPPATPLPSPPNTVSAARQLGEGPFFSSPITHMDYGHCWTNHEIKVKQDALAGIAVQSSNKEVSLLSKEISRATITLACQLVPFCNREARIGKTPFPHQTTIPRILCGRPDERQDARKSLFLCKECK